MHFKGEDKKGSEGHRHGLLNMFKKESPGPESGVEESDSSSHGMLGKIFHHHGGSAGSSVHNSDGKEGTALNRTASMTSIRRQKSQAALSKVERESTTLSKAQTLAHIQHLNQKNAAKAQLASSKGPAPAPHHQEKIVYNPFGIKNSNSSQVTKNTSFYLSGVNDGERILANPVANPNDYLPDEYKQDHLNLLDDFDIDANGKKIGSGGSSDVRFISDHHNKKKVFALKKFTLLNKESDEEFYARTAKEYVISKQLSRSRHILNTFAIVRIQSQGSITRGWGMVLEYCAGGDLFNLIVKPGWKRAYLNEKFCLFKQIAYGLKFMHDQGIAHRDIKPENVLLDEHGVAKLCDFGVSDYVHEIPDDLNSPLRLSTSYVGSPPYTPPEVMKLKDCSHHEIKNYAYSPYQMDHWGLGMILFCLVYGGVPFQSAAVSDIAYRDYKFNHERFSSTHSSFKNNEDFSKGPGTEFKWASQFHSSGAARVAWKLCDPSVKTRYDLELLFNDPWFTGLEMCLYEHPDQEIDPLVLETDSHNNSRSSSVANSRAPSRRNTYTKSHDAEKIPHTPVRSMLDLGDHFDAHKKENDSSSIKSSSSLANSPASHVGISNRTSSGSLEKVQRSHNRSRSNSQNDLIAKTKSLLDVSETPHKDNGLPALKEAEKEESEREEYNVSNVSNNYTSKGESDDHSTAHDLTTSENGSNNTSVKEKIDQKNDIDVSDHDSSDENEKEKSEDETNSSSGSIAHSFASAQAGNEQEEQRDGSDLEALKNDKNVPHILAFEAPPLKQCPNVTIDSHGMCELGYKLKRHHHLDVSNVAVSGSLSRMR